MKAELHRFSLPLHEPFVTAAASINRREGLLLRVEADDGAVGWGEAAPLPGHPGGTDDSVDAALRLWCADPRAANKAALSACPVAAAAVDTALVTINAIREDVPLAVHLAGAGATTSVPLNAVVGSGVPEEQVWQAGDAVAAGYQALKLKVGGRPVDADVATVATVRETVGPEIELRLDANQAWSAAEAARFLAAVADLGVAYVEEPTADLDEWPALAAHGVALAADESLALDPPDPVFALVRRGVVSVLITKVPTLSGLRPALAASGMASARGATTVVTSFIDTAIGLHAALHLAAALGPAVRPAGLATASLLAADVAEPPTIVDGCMLVPAGVGLGVEPDLSALKG